MTTVQEFLLTISPVFWTWVVPAVGVFTAAHALLNKRDPRAAIGWIVVCLAVPIIGVPAYLLLGVNRIRTRARELTADSELHVSEHKQHSGQLVYSSGNSINALFDADKTFEQMLGAIDSASSSIQLSTYIFGKRGIGQKFIDQLANAVTRGVKVRVLLDGVGAFYSSGSTFKELRRRGVRIEKFLPPRLIPMSMHINLRNHRKLLIVDRTTAFVGGMNIRRGYLSDDGNAASIRDTHFKVSGPIVGELDKVFARDWAIATGTKPRATEIVVNQTESGNSGCRLVIDGPDNDLDLITVEIQEMIAEARKFVRIMTPYFLPPRELVVALQAAARRGVEVDIILPEKNNLLFVHWATRNTLWQLINYGIRIYYQPGVFNHSKLMVVDQSRSHIGSANIDPRSLRLNFELGITVDDEKLAITIDNFLLDAIQVSNQFTKEDLDSRSLGSRLRDALAWLFSPYL